MTRRSMKRCHATRRHRSFRGSCARFYHAVVIGTTAAAGGAAV
jgi:hypothetical protein